MMKPDVFIRFVIGKPAKADPIAIVRPAKMLVRALKRYYGEVLRDDKLRLAHHISFVGTITVNGYQQRKGPFAFFGQMQIVIKVDFGRDRNVYLRILIWHRKG